MTKRKASSVTKENTLLKTTQHMSSAPDVPLKICYREIANVLTDSAVCSASLDADLVGWWVPILKQRWWSKSPFFTPLPLGSSHREGLTRNMECWASVEWAVYVLLSRDSLNHLPLVSHSQHFVSLTLFLSDYAKCLWRHLLFHYRHCHHYHYPQNALNCHVYFWVVFSSSPNPR